MEKSEARKEQAAVVSSKNLQDRKLCAEMYSGQILFVFFTTLRESIRSLRSTKYGMEIRSSMALRRE